MRFSSFTYLVGQGLHNLRANRLMTFASMGVLTVCMLLIGAAYLLGVNIDAMVEYIGDQNNILQISFGLDWWEDTRKPDTEEIMEHLHTEMTVKGD